MQRKNQFNGCMARQNLRAFTLVEILIVVVILGILAAIVVPQFTSAGEDARNQSLKMTIHRLRGQIEIYHGQHNCTYPTFANFIDQMTLATDVHGNTAAVGTPGFPYGPYIRDFPINPRTSNKVLIGVGAIGTSDWFYEESSGEFRANDSAESADW